MPKEQNNKQINAKFVDYVSLKVKDSPLAELLQQWVELVRQIYTATGCKHAPYSYKEQANVGVLASAASKIGWAALEECTVLRGKNNGKKSNCRVDLSLWSKSGEEYLFEAKLTVRSVKSLRNRLPVVIESAIEDARELGDDGHAMKYAIVFVIPRFEKDDDIKTIQSDLVDATTLCRGDSPDFEFPDSKTPDFIAYTFPGCVERRAHDHMDSDMYACGVIVMGFRVS